MHKTLVISIDALCTCDIKRLCSLPNIGPIVRGAAIAKDILCVYPTLTYPCHVAIATGCYPERTGIYNNEKLQPNAVKAEWYWWSKDVQVPTVIDYAKEAGLTTATVTWPVMCGSAADYNIGEIWAPTEQDDPAPYFAKADSPLAHDIFEKNKHMLCWMKTPQMDEFAAQCAVDIIQKEQPDLMLLHLSYVDHQRHRLGVHGPLDHAFEFVDAQLGRVLDALREKGTLDETNIVILGDHGQLYCDEMFHLNSILRDKGYITTENGQITSWRAYSHSCSLSAQVYVKNPEDEEKVYQELLDMKNSYPQYIDAVWTKAEVKEKYHLDGPFSFVVEAADRVCIGKSAHEKTYITKVNDITEYKPSISSHGHCPEKGDKPPFIAKGPDVKEGVMVTGGRMIDEAPTILAMLGISAPQMDGKPLDMVKK